MKKIVTLTTFLALISMQSFARDYHQDYHIVAIWRANAPVAGSTGIPTALLGVSTPANNYEEWDKCNYLPSAAEQVPGRVTISILHIPARVGALPGPSFENVTCEVGANRYRKWLSSFLASIPDRAGSDLTPADN